jgi:hypothetical protein
MNDIALTYESDLFAAARDGAARAGDVRAPAFTRIVDDQEGIRVGGAAAGRGGPSSFRNLGQLKSLAVA